MTRTRRFLGGVTLGSLQLVLATAVGLWMTPFLLGHVGSRILGYWLVAQQLLGYLQLMDFGVNELLPREAAYTVGRASQSVAGADLPTVIARARQAVRWQIPLVTVASIAAGYVVLARGGREALPLLLVLAAFVLLFPTRLYQATLQGLQDLVFLGRLQILTWAASIALTVLLVLNGAGLWALVTGWVIGQVVTSVACWVEMRREHPDAWPARSVSPPWMQVRPYVVSAGWVSIAQVAQVLLSGSDLLIVGSLLGTSSVVLYACTSKLTTVLANQPQLIMVSAMPALSELWAGRQRERLLELVSALTLAMLTISGLVACLTLAVNEGFVTWWVGAAQYGGATLTLLLAIQLLLRHWNITLIYGLVAFGLERRVSITNLVDGVASIALSVLFIRRLGPVGAVLGSIVAVLVTSLPANLVGLARRTETSPWIWCRSLLPWAARLAPLALLSFVIARVWPPTALWQLVAVTLAVSATYALVMVVGLRKTPFGAFIRPRMEAIFGPRVAWLRTT
jgi:O-antigen/teichoic acid export membrane protein